jgi:hypothetical protein
LRQGRQNGPWRSSINMVDWQPRSVLHGRSLAICRRTADWSLWASKLHRDMVAEICRHAHHPARSRAGKAGDPILARVGQGEITIEVYRKVRFSKSAVDRFCRFQQRFCCVRRQEQNIGTRGGKDVDNCGLGRRAVIDKFD